MKSTKSKRIMRRGAAFLLMLCLLLSCLVACESKDPAEETTAGAPTDTTAEVPTEAQGTETTTAAETDGEGETTSGEESSQMSEAERKAKRMAQILATTQTGSLSIGGWSTPASALRDGYSEIEGNYDAMYQKLADAGIDYMITLEEWSSPYWLQEALHSAKAAGMKIYYNAQGQDFSWTKEQIDVMLASEDVDALAGIYVKDEPTYDGLEELATQTEQIRAYLKEQGREDLPVFSNLLPIYASGSMVGGNYMTYVEEYAAKTTPDYLLFDYYPYAVGSESLGNMIGNLAAFRKVANETGAPLVPFVQSSGWSGMSEPNQYQMLASAHINLAFGAKSFIYYVLCEYQANWSTTAILKADGTTNKQYDRVKAINQKLDGMQGVYLSYENVGVMLANFSQAESSVKKYAPDLLLESYEGLVSVEAKKDTRVLIGCFRNADGARALYVVNCEPSKNAKITLTFDKATEAALWGYNGLEDLLEGESITVSLEKGQGVFLTLSDSGS